MFRFKSFRSRILTFFIGLLAVIQLSTLYLVDVANTQNANALIGEALQTTVQSFNNLINSRNQSLIQAGRLLSGDFAFKTAFASGSPATITSALDNHRSRIKADLMFLLDMQGQFISISGKMNDLSMETDSSFPFPDFLAAAENTGDASGVIYFNEQLYSVIAVPLLTPIPSAWIIIGFEIDDAFIKTMQQESQAEISLIIEQQGERMVHISTLDPEMTQTLTGNLNSSSWVMQSVFELDIASHPYITYIDELSSWGPAHPYSVLQRDRNAAMAPYIQLRSLLLALLVIAISVSIFAGAGIASRVSKPVKQLADFAGEVQKGNYDKQVIVNQADELGQLATAFNNMSQGLFERDKVRNLLGKVISPEIAEELINKDVQLGGEERHLTILFTDLRNFTSMSETRSATEVLDFLNEYLTSMTAVIDKHGGVVDKYIGDAIMALFGAPLTMENHADSAVQSALEMIAELENINQNFRQKGWPELAMGVGINTGTVVVGNMGSKDRLNYTVIGDGVNLASRLESITKEYGTPIIVSEATKNAAPNFNYKKLDHIKVKGKQEPVTIYAPG